ncbi:oligosaccharide flippase family protein [Hymenobacter sp. BT664]|uniref:Oligosaccharide flippase family protein n=1 Tax=Hymenobacter montanus TaxID=2771359 RepID=A0A927GHH5_9BACT|nr:oligosaccharide flippase family protein [Hymenobacter montanus]MBD2766418.1 oligosaccharide flippase family protein [Hymenobacter montanus]
MSEISRTKSAFWGIISTQAFTIISMVVSIVSTPLMVRYLDKDAYGLSIIFFQIINYLALFDFGLSTAVIRKLALHRGDDEYNRLMVNKIMSTGVLVAAAFGLFVTLVGIGFAPLLPRIYNLRADLAAPAVPIVITLSLLVGGQFVLRCLGGIFFAHHRQTLIATPIFVVNILTTGLTITLLSRGVGLWAFVYANVFQLVGSLTCQIVLLHTHYSKLRIKIRFYDKQLTGSMLSYGFFMFLHGLATQIILFTDRLVIGKVLSLSLVTVFSLTVRIPEVGMSLLGLVTSNSLPAIAEIVEHEGSARTRVYFNRLMLVIVTLSMTAFWLMLSLDEWFIRLWVGNSFFAGQQVLTLALIIMVQQTIARTGTFFLNAKGIARSVSFAAIVEAVLNLTLSIGLSYRLGMIGILLGTILAALLTSTWFVPYQLKKHFDISLIDSMIRPVVWPVIGISAAGAGVYFLVQILAKGLIFNPWIGFLLAGLVASGLLGAFVWLVYLRNLLGEYVPMRFRRYLLINS